MAGRVAGGKRASVRFVVDERYGVGERVRCRGEGGGTRDEESGEEGEVSAATLTPSPPPPEAPKKKRTDERTNWPWMSPQTVTGHLTG